MDVFKVIKVTKITTEHKKTPEIGQYSITSYVFAQRAKKLWSYLSININKIKVSRHRDARPEKNLLIFGNCLNHLATPPLIPPSVFLDTYEALCLKTEKSADIFFFIMSKFRQNSASKVSGLGLTSHPLPPL